MLELSALSEVFSRLVSLRLTLSKGVCMKEKKSYQLYLLEGEIEKAQFEYDREFRSNAKMEKQMKDFKFTMKLGGLYALVLSLYMGMLVIWFRGNWDFMITLGLLEALGALLVFTYGAFAHKQSGVMSYQNVKGRLLDSEERLFMASQNLSKLLLQKEQLQEEMGQELVVESDVKENLSEKWENMVEQEDLECRKNAIRFQKSREEKEKNRAFAELQNIVAEEVKVETEKKTYKFWWILSIVGMVIGLFIACSGEPVYAAIGRLLVLSLLVFVFIPFFFLYSTKLVYTSLGSDVWINRILLKELHEESLPVKKQKLQEEIAQREKCMEELDVQYKQLEQEIETVKIEYGKMQKQDKQEEVFDYSMLESF